MEGVARTGITGVDDAQRADARARGLHWRLVAALDAGEGPLHATVRPELLRADDPLAGVPGVMNAITYRTDLLGRVTLMGPGAGRRETGYALLRDLLDVVHSGHGRATEGGKP